jgi:hypothetical protein
MSHRERLSADFKHISSMTLYFYVDTILQRRDNNGHCLFTALRSVVETKRKSVPAFEQTILSFTPAHQAHNG